jgi:hypothetical protein
MLIWPALGWNPAWTERRRSRAVGTDQADDLASANLEREVVDGREHRRAATGVRPGKMPH